MNIADPDIEACRLYRLYVLYRLPQLEVLDCSQVSVEVSMYYHLFAYVLSCLHLVH